MASEELINLKENLSALEAFIGSRAYRGFIAARQAELEAVSHTILEMDPIDREDEIEILKLRGEKRCLEDMLTTFERVAEELRDKISELEDEEEGTTQSPTTGRDELGPAGIKL